MPKYICVVLNVFSVNAKIYLCCLKFSQFYISVEGEKIQKVTIVGQEKILLNTGLVYSDDMIPICPS